MQTSDFSQFFKWEMSTKSFTIVHILKNKGYCRNSITNEVITLIENWLKELEEKHNIDILFASETGSRAWGGATEHSDHDIRFIFKHQDVKTYLSLGKAQETIDSPPFDAQGWDLFKAFTFCKNQIQV